jgi:membrane protease YdiL (CAAX protease family)
MLSAKPWKADAAMRLLLSVFVCVYAGSLIGSVRHYATTGGGRDAKLVYLLAAVSFGFLGATLVLLSKPWRLESFMRRLVGLLICFYIGFFVGAWAQKLAGLPGTSLAQMIIGSLAFQGAGLVLIARFLEEQQMSWGEGFGFTNNWRHAAMLGLLVAMVFLPIGWGLQQASALVMTHVPHFRMEPEEQPAVQALRAASAWGPRLALGVVAIFLAPVTEELLFRGIFYPLVKQAGFPRLALWGTSFVFAAIHLNAVTFVPLMALALVLTLLYERTDNLLAPMTTHAMFNALNFVTLWVVQER